MPKNFVYAGPTARTTCLRQSAPWRRPSAAVTSFEMSTPSEEFGRGPSGLGRGSLGPEVGPNSPQTESRFSMPVATRRTPLGESALRCSKEQAQALTLRARGMRRDPSGVRVDRKARASGAKRREAATRKNTLSSEAPPP